MYSAEPLVTPQSDYYIYLPGSVARKIYLYPLITGHFSYEPGYCIHRNNYDNYLLMYIEKGSCFLDYGETHTTVRKGQAAFIDCRKPHSYGNRTNSLLEVSWLHFDGALAPQYYDLVTSVYGNVISPVNPYEITHNLEKILTLFRTSAPVHEASVSARITRMLNELITTRSDTTGETARSEIIENSLVFLNEHFQEPLTLEQIAGNVNLSPYYFTRIFTAETGSTPHQYLIAVRINTAKYLLLSTNMSVKEIAFRSGFSNESSFCSTFRKREKMTPGEYRANVGAAGRPSP